MRSNYRKLGEFIREVNIRNADLSVDLLLGVSIQKMFIPSIANTIGTNMTNYKIVEKGQFVYGTVTSRNGDKVSIALLEEYEKAIVSQAYKVFEIVNHNELLPEYLMMWFKRPEFDRYARFHSHGSAREIFDWQDMCEVELPVPDIQTQQAIVDEYQAVQRKIALNEQLISKLEETAQTIYQQWFVNFDFPDEKGNPYQSSGGEMEFSEELEKEVPKGWGVKRIKDFSKEIITGKTPSTSDEKNFFGNIPFLTIPDMHSKNYVFTTERYLSDKGALKAKILPRNSICVSCIGTAGLVVINAIPSQTNQQINSIIPFKKYYLYYLFLTIKSMKNKIQEWGGKGSVGVNMNKTEFSELDILFPNEEILEQYNKLVENIFTNIKTYEQMQENLKKMKNLLLSKIASGER